MPKLPPPPSPDDIRVRLPQLRILAALAGDADNPDNTPLLTRHKICERTGFSEISGTINAALNGTPEGSSTINGGPRRPGLLELDLVRRSKLTVEGDEELVFEITPAGLAVLERQRAELEKSPALRDAASSTNRRYKDK